MRWHARCAPGAESASRGLTDLPTAWPCTRLATFPSVWRSAWSIASCASRQTRSALRCARSLKTREWWLSLLAHSQSPGLSATRASAALLVDLSSPFCPARTSISIGCRSSYGDRGFSTVTSGRRRLLLRLDLGDERACFLHHFIGDAHVPAIGVVNEPVADAGGLQLFDEVHCLLHRDRLVIVGMNDEDGLRGGAQVR